MSRALPIISMSFDDTLYFDKYQNATQDKAFIDGHYYSDKAPLSSMLVFPVYHFITFFSDNSSVSENVKTVISLGSFICGSLPFALIVLLFFLHLPARNHQERVLLSMLPLYGGFTFVFSGTFFSHILAAFLILSALLAYQEKKFTLAGLLAGLAMLSEYTMALALFIWPLQMLVKKVSLKNILRFFIGALPTFLFLLFYNWTITGDPFSFTYNFVSDTEFSEMKNSLGFHVPGLEAIFGLLLGIERGLFLYCPILLYFLWYSISGLRKKSALQDSLKKLVLNEGLMLALAIFLSISSFYMWWGGWSYGPRYLIPATVLLLFEGACWLCKKNYSQRALIIFCFLGLLPAWLAKSTAVYRIPYHLPNPFIEPILTDFVGGFISTQNILSPILSLPDYMAVLIWIPLFVFSTLFLIEHKHAAKV